VTSIEEKLTRMDLYRKGVSISEIARQTGRDRKTVRKAVTEHKAARKRKAPHRAKSERKLSPYESYLKQRMAEGV
jgi:transposase